MKVRINKITNDISDILAFDSKINDDDAAKIITTWEDEIIFLKKLLKEY